MSKASSLVSVLLVLRDKDIDYNGVGIGYPGCVPLIQMFDKCLVTEKKLPSKEMRILRLQIMDLLVGEEPGYHKSFKNVDPSVVEYLRDLYLALPNVFILLLAFAQQCIKGGIFEISTEEIQKIQDDPTLAFEDGGFVHQGLPSIKSFGEELLSNQSIPLSLWGWGTQEKQYSATGFWKTYIDPADDTYSLQYPFPSNYWSTGTPPAEVEPPEETHHEG